MKHSEQVKQIVNEIWSSMLGTSIDPVGENPDVAASSTISLCGCISITGNWEGSLVVCCPLEMARNIAETMFAMDAGTASESEIRDALGEITNMIGGNFKAIVNGGQLGLPSVVEGANICISSPGTQITCQEYFSSGEHKLKVIVQEKTP